MTQVTIEDLDYLNAIKRPYSLIETFAKRLRDHF